MRLVLLICLVWKVSSGTNLENGELRKQVGFFFTMPKILFSGRNSSVCMSIHSTHQSVPNRIIVDLKIKEKHFFTTRTVLNTEHTCFDLIVPKYKLSEPQFVSVKVQIQINGVVYSAHNQDPVVIYPQKRITFIETDRDFYKARDRVKIRVLVVGHDLLPVRNHKLGLIKVKNPFDVAVGAWDDVATEAGLAQVEHELTKDAVEGKWTIDVDGETKSFEVKKYVLPRFKVEIIHPKIIFFETDSIEINVCSKYSHGGHVKGTAFIRLMDTHKNMHPIQLMKKMEDGCAKFTFTSTDLNLLTIKKLHTLMDPKISVQITATVTEYGTDKIEMATAKVPISLKAYTMKITSSNMFLPGIVYEGRLELSNIQAELRGETVEICYNLAIRRSWNYLSNSEQCSNFTVDRGNFVDFQVPPLKSNVIHLHLSARSLNHTNLGDSLLVIRLYSPSSTYITLKAENHDENTSKSGSLQQFMVEFTTEKMHDGENVTFYYMIKTRGQLHKLRKITRIVHKANNPDYGKNYKEFIGGKHKFLRAASSVDHFLIKFKLDEKIVSSYQLVVYFVTGQGEVVSAMKEVEIEPCLNNKVASKWSHTVISPGGTASLLIETQSESLCAISAVDKASKFHSRSQHFDMKSLLRPFLHEIAAPDSNRKSCVAPSKKSGKSEEVSAAFTENNHQENEDSMWDLRRRKRFVYSFSEDFDAYDIFNKFGTTTITNFKIVTKPCYTGPTISQNSAVQFLTDQYDVNYEDKIVPIRSFFPETWLWELVPVRGATVLHREVPHSITKWITNVMCVSNTHGIGFSETAEITAHQFLFVDVLTPYSIKRGETLYLHVIVFNQFSYNLPIKLSITGSQGLKFLDPPDKRTMSYCIASNSTITNIYEIQGIATGNVNVTVIAEVDSNFPAKCGPETVIHRRDVVLKTFLVEPEGYAVTDTKSALLCTSESTPKTNVSWRLALPDSAVPQTVNSRVVINGDLMAQTLENLEELIVLPTGCGEQIMASLAPNLHILHYLNATKSLTSSLKQRILRNLKIGYQRILNYVHKDGSFSPFGYHDPSGSMFLTSFVVKVLREAKRYIFVDRKVIDKAVAWILEHQLENGCFNTMYHVFQEMGGTNSENSTAALTSYVILSLLDSRIEIPEAVRTNAKYCIRGHYQLDKYTIAISAYSLLKIQWPSEANRMLNKLYQIAHEKDGMMYWTNKDFDAYSTASDIEITSYVLLALLEQNTAESLAKAHSVARWLSSKRGPQGGFKSTQDTVVALEALTKYALYLNGQKLDLEIELETIDQNHKWTVIKSDGLKTKRVKLKEQDEVTVIVKGQGCVLVQATQNYYKRELPSNAAFTLDMEVNSVSSVDKCSIANLQPCFKHEQADGDESVANMAILEVDLPSGYVADRASLYKLVDDVPAQVKMFEEQESKVVFYLTKVGTHQVCIDFNINENALVKSRLNSTVKLYDYYKPHQSIMKFYEIRDQCTVNNLTMPEITINNTETTKNIVKRDVLNPDFVDMDMELATPNGMEGNQPVYMKPNNTSNIKVDLNVDNSLDNEDKNNVTST